jgi:hypothetical protein
MKSRAWYMAQIFAAVAIFMTFVCLPAAAQSLYEQYLNTPKETLESETDEMGKNLKQVFNEGGIERQQQKIDFADYFSNFKKLVLYGAKLANYAEYEENLTFAKDKEIFKGLPEAEGETNTQGTYDQKAFVNEKYEKMKGNITEEIDTYVDLIKISLDACEIMSRNDLSGFMENANNQRSIRRYLDESEAYHAFAERQERLNKGWPNLARRISDQVRLWQEAQPSPEDPIIDPAITEAIL